MSSLRVFQYDEKRQLPVSLGRGNIKQELSSDNLEECLITENIVIDEDLEYLMRDPDISMLEDILYGPSLTWESTFTHQDFCNFR